MEKVGQYDPYRRDGEAKLLMHNCREGPKGNRAKFGVFFYARTIKSFELSFYTSQTSCRWLVAVTQFLLWRGGLVNLVN